MKIKLITVQGFRSFSAPQTWMPGVSGPGLYHLTGRNESEPALEANGAGKSSLFESLFWVLYGRTSRGLRAGNVQCWLPKSPKCRVELNFEHHGTTYSLVRTWNPNALTIADEIDGGIIGVNLSPSRNIDQTELDTLLGIGPEAFLQAVYFAQFTPAFVDLAPADRLAMFGEVLRLERWERASAHASAQAKEATAKRAAVDNKIASTEGELRGIDPKGLEKSEKEWEQDRERKLNELDIRRKSAEKEITTLKRKQGGTERLVSTTPKPPQVKNLNELRSELTKQELYAKKVLSETSSIQTLLRGINKELARVSSLNTGDLCPICKQAVSAIHVRSEVRRLKDDHAKTLAEEEVLVLASDQAEDSVKALRKQVEDERERTTKEQLTENARISAAAAIESEIRHLVLDANRLRAEIADTYACANPHTAARERAVLRCQELSTTLLELRGQAEDASQLTEAFSYWAKGFKDLRLYVVQHVLAQLEVQTANTLIALGLGAWAVKFSVEQETKSGTLRRGLSVLVKSPGAPEAVPFEAWSGGESQRLRLAVSMGLAGLISGQLGLDCDLECWDEPTTWMSGAGIIELMEVLQERAQGAGKAIWLADHRVLDYGGFAGGICAAKTALGTRLVGT